VNLEQIVHTFGYAGLFGIIFAESGLFFGFFLPGDSLLLTAGLLASRIDPATGQPILNVLILLPLLAFAAILGDNVGYWFGNKTGPRIFNRENSRFFKKKNLIAAHEFYKKHGGKTIVLARFMPFIRTFAPIVAGAVDMEYRRFVFFNFFGGLFWVMLMTLVGFFLGKAAADVAPETVDRYFLILVLAVIFISALPAMIHLWRDNRDEIMRRLRRQPAPSPVEPAED
jgi:membrane-associated protein